MLNLATQINRRINYLKKYHPPKSTPAKIPFPREALLKVYADPADPQSVPKALSRLLTAAKQSGVSEQRVRKFLAYGYVPQPMQLRFHGAARLCDQEDGPTQIGLGGARGPGKSHGLFAQVALDDCQRQPGLKVLYLRRVQKNAREQFDDLRAAVLKDRDSHEYSRHEGLIKFKNGSRIILGHFKNESDIDQYLGLEYDVIAPEEATTLTLTKYRALRDSNRTSKPGWRPRMYSSTNPGGVGHAWYKKLFIEPFKKHEESDTRFVPGTVDDNAFIDAGYTKKLEENTGWKLKAYRFGDWDIAAGQYYSTWHHDSIVRKGLTVMPGAPVWCSLDYGFQHPTAVYLFSEYDGKVQIVDEYWKQKGLVSFNAAGIKAMLERHDLTVGDLNTFVAGHDVFATRGNASEKTIAKEYEEEGIRLTHANIDRINGAGRLLKLLGDPLAEKPIEPQIEISDRCVRLIECLPQMQHDPHRPEDVLKVNIDDDGNGGDDPYDAARYGAMARQPLEAVKPVSMPQVNKWGSQVRPSNPWMIK